jgi:hypothetical protein
LTEYIRHGDIPSNQYVWLVKRKKASAQNSINLLFQYLQLAIKRELTFTGTFSTFQSTFATSSGIKSAAACVAIVATFHDGATSLSGAPAGELSESSM